jgi:hypothetical protein
MKKAKLTRSLMAACSIVALSAVMYGCVHSGGDDAPAAMDPPPIDTDGDGVADADDAFPNDPNETADADGDGVGDNAQEAMALDAAQDAAMAAWEMARDALASIAGDESENPVAYQRAMNALADAKAAYDAAAAATTSADAEMNQADAEAARDTATTQVAAVVYSRDMEAIGAARMAAEQAAQAAKRAYEAAKMALAAVEDFKALDMASYDMAMAQLTAAKMAYDAAMAASNQAAEAMLLGDAEDQRDAARTAMGNADAANTNATKYADMVRDAENAALADAQMKADEAYKAAKMTAGEARQAANDADAEATAAEEANVGSPAAMDSRTAANEAAEAATDAETAAMAAGTAKMAADDAATSAAAKMHRAEAETQKGNAETHLVTANARKADATTSKIIAQNTGAGTLLIWQQRAMDANEEAAGYASAARAAADKADAQADAAEADAARAMRARTNYASAKAKAADARSAANAAEAAASAAETAATTASNSLAMATADDATTAVAREQSNVARTAAMGAAGEPAKANTGYMNAMEAAGEAEMYAGRHIISLLSHANAQDLDLGDPADIDLATALAKAKDDRLKAVSGAIKSAAGTAGTDADNDSSSDDGSAGTTASATWPAFSTVDDSATEDVDESVVGTLSIMVNPNGGGVTDALTFRTMASEDDPDTPAEDESVTEPKTATKLSRGLGDFGHGYQIEEGANHAIVFTDKQKGTPAVAAVEAVTARMVEKEAVTAVTELSLGADKTGPTFTGVTWTPSGEVPLMGTLNCADTANCDIQINADGSISSIEGYTFTGSRDAVAAVEAADAMEDDDYLAFGVWLQEISTATQMALRSLSPPSLTAASRSQALLTM